MERNAGLDLTTLRPESKPTVGHLTQVSGVCSLNPGRQEQLSTQARFTGFPQ